MSRRQRLTLLAAICGSAVATIDGSIVNVALPAIEHDLGQVSGAPAESTQDRRAPSPQPPWRPAAPLPTGSPTSVTAAALPSSTACSAVVVANRCMIRATMPVQPV